MINYNYALYRKDNKGNPNIWFGKVIAVHILEIHYGILGKTISVETINTGNRTATAELESRINAKRKVGYILLSEVKDDCILPVEEHSIKQFLITYLPNDRSNSNGAMLPMLAKLYDNKNNRLFKDGLNYLLSYKLNGLRGMIGAVANHGDMFKPIRLTFQSRDGIYWDSMTNLEDYLLRVLPVELIDNMINNNWLLDGEMYLYGYTVNDINSFVKSPSNPENKLLQFWCYDIAIPEMSASFRNELLVQYLGGFMQDIQSKQDHIDVKDRLVLVETWNGYSNSNCTHLRDNFIEWGFEGVCGRHPNKEYQYGKRNDAMWKYKSVTDGKFKIIEIVPEGTARDGIPLLLLRNDINDAIFRVHISGNFEYQRSILISKEAYIDRMVFVEYGERSGVEQVPFHVKTVTLVEE